MADTGCLTTAFILGGSLLILFSDTTALLKLVVSVETPNFVAEWLYEFR